MKIILTLAACFVALSARAADVPVAARALDRGALMTEADLAAADGTAWSNRIILREARDIVGKELKRRMNEGEAFRISDLKSPTLIKRGQLVALLVSSGGLQIAAAGRAMQDGSVGDIIKTQNTASRTIVEGEVTSNGTIKIDLIGAPRLPDAK